MPLKYETLQELQEAYLTGAIPSDISLAIDNDTASVYIPTGPEDDEYATSEQVYQEHPGIILEDALDLLGIPHEGV